MPENNLNPEQRQMLLQMARRALETAVRGEPLPVVDPQSLPGEFLLPGATFVTLTRGGDLRGCIGALEPYQSLVDDVREHAVAAGMQDFRFPPVRPEELPEIHIEISRLTEPVPLTYDGPEDLLHKLRPGVDGVVLRDGWKRATFLPQVWEKLPLPAEFLDHLCYKMGVAPDHWRHKKLEVLIYQVEEFQEQGSGVRE